ncbi:hypothetical protein HZS_7110 [Henneguya salminicola]|nr:hypothetical protein HZS_7110 [Henneguya salminicola]
MYSKFIAHDILVVETGEKTLVAPHIINRHSPFKIVSNIIPKSISNLDHNQNFKISKTTLEYSNLLKIGKISTLDTPMIWCIKRMSFPTIFAL